MELTKAVKMLRTQVGESQQVFATKLGISIRGLVNYEKDREPPLALLLKLAAIARDTGNDNLADVFQWAFYEQIMNATRGYQNFIPSRGPARGFWTGVANVCLGAV